MTQGRSRSSGRSPRPATPVYPVPDLPPLPRRVEREIDDVTAPGRRAAAKVALQKALAAREEGRLSAALAAAGRAKDASPRSPTVRATSGVLARARGRYRDALADLQAYRRLTGDLRYEPLVADCYRALRRPARALEVVSDLTPGRLGPTAWVEAQLVRAAAHADQGHLDAAIGVLRAGESATTSEPGRRRLRAARQRLEAEGAQPRVEKYRT